MTIPSERTRNLVQTGAFLSVLAADDRLPERIRREAVRLLRHYPSVIDLRLIALESRESLLVADHDPAWLRGYWQRKP